MDSSLYPEVPLSDNRYLDKGQGYGRLTLHFNLKYLAKLRSTLVGLFKVLVSNRTRYTSLCNLRSRNLPATRIELYKILTSCAQSGE